MKVNKFILGAVVLLMTGCGKKTPPSSSAEESQGDELISITQEQFDLNDFALGNLEEQNIPETVVTNGMIDVPPQNEAIVSAIKGGFVRHTHLIVGEEIKEGQQMVILENPEYLDLQKEYLSIVNQLSYLEAEYKRKKTLYQENISSERNFLQAKSKFEMAKSSRTALKKELQLLNISPKAVESGKISSRRTIVAPISGDITKVNISKGSFISPSTNMFEIVNNNDIHLELMVYEKDILKVKEGQKIQFQIPETGSEIYKGEVHLVGTSIDKTNRTVEVHGHPDDQAQFLRGMFVKAEIIVGMKKIMALPRQAVVERDGNYYALILQSKDEGNYEFAKVNIEPGRIYNDFIEINNHKDYKKDNVFLVKGAFDLIAN